MSTIVRWSALFTLLFLSPHTRFCHILRRVHSHIWTLCQICLPIFFSQHGLKLRFLLDHSQFLLYNLGKKKGKKRLSYIYMLFAGIDSKSVGGDTVWVRPPSPAFLIPKPFSGLGIFCVADKISACLPFCLPLLCQMTDKTDLFSVGFGGQVRPTEFFS